MVESGPSREEEVLACDRCALVLTPLESGPIRLTESTLEVGLFLTSQTVNYCPDCRKEISLPAADSLWRNSAGDLLKVVGWDEGAVHFLHVVEDCTLHVSRDTFPEGYTRATGNLAPGAIERLLLP